MSMPRSPSPRARLAVLAVLLLALPGCDVVEGIFKAGMWVGIVLVVAVLAAIVWVVSKLRR